jgi:hypothetical protein
MFQNRVLRIISGTKRDEVKEDWKGMHIEEFHDLYCAQHFIRVIKSRRMRWAGHVAYIAEEEMCMQGFFLGGGNMTERAHLKD